MSQITNQQIDAILPFLNQFEAPGFVVGKWTPSPDGTQTWEYSEPVLKFQEVLYKNGWIQSFDWPNWQDDAKKYVATPSEMDSANAETIQKLLTTHVRKERFSEGHLLDMFNNGHIVALLRRLKDIRQIQQRPNIRTNSPGLILSKRIPNAAVHLQLKQSMTSIVKIALLGRQASKIFPKKN